MKGVKTVYVRALSFRSVVDWRSFDNRDFWLESFSYRFRSRTVSTILIFESHHVSLWFVVVFAVVAVLNCTPIAPVWVCPGAWSLFSPPQLATIRLSLHIKAGDYRERLSCRSCCCKCTEGDTVKGGRWRAASSFCSDASFKHGWDSVAGDGTAAAGPLQLLCCAALSSRRETPSS